MKSACSIAFLVALLVVPSAHAVDEGQTRPRVSSNSLVNFNTQMTLILTNGSGNIKGILCRSASSSQLYNLSLHFFVDGGAAEIISLSGFPFLQDSASKYHTEFIPMNVRFETSIRLDVQRSSTVAETTCTVSWGLD